MPRINVIEKFCKSCGLCIEVCPKKIIAIGDTANDKGYFTAVCINQDECIGCGRCATALPADEGFPPARRSVVWPGARRRTGCARAGAAR